MTRLLNWIDLLLDALTLGQYGLEPEPETQEPVDETDWCDWAWEA